MSGVEHFGPRSHIRTTIPKGTDLAQVHAAADHLENNGHPIFACLLLVMRGLGLRLREAFTQDYVRLLHSMDDNDEVLIVEGTKGGNGKWMERRVPVPRCLEVEYVLIVLTGMHDLYDLGCVHDLRSAMACQWFEELTGHKAPLFNQGRASLEAENAARDIISKRMGHKRRNVTNAYIGGKKKNFDE